MSQSLPRVFICLPLSELLEIMCILRQGNDGGGGVYGDRIVKIESNGDFDIDSDGTVGADTDCDL